MTFYTLNPLTEYPNEKGIAGVYDVPELLTLCKLDSAPVKDVGNKIKEAFAALESDLKETGAETAGPQGIVYYNNSPENFKFECILLIKKMPARVPVKSRIVMLEADKMLLYNYYGAYESTFEAYGDIRKYCDEHHLQQSGPMREFYSADEANEKDVSKWLTRIMLPVTLIQPDKAKSAR